MRRPPLSARSLSCFPYTTPFLSHVLDSVERAHGFFQVVLVCRVVFALLAVAEDAALHAVEILAGILDDVGGAVDHGIEQAAQHGIGIGAQAGLALGAGDELAERPRIEIGRASCRERVCQYG